MFPRYYPPVEIVRYFRHDVQLYVLIAFLLLTFTVIGSFPVYYYFTWSVQLSLLSVIIWWNRRELVIDVI